MTLSPARIITTFVGSYDRPFKYDECLADLLRSNAFQRPNSNDNEALLLYVGACYIQMVRADVLYELQEGVIAERKSAPFVDKLKSKWMKWDCNSPSPAYVLARWHDAKGRLLYRTGNYPAAQALFSEALTFAESSNVDGAILDIKSNLHRTRMEVDRMIFPDAKLMSLDVFKPRMEKSLNACKELYELGCSNTNTKNDEEKRSAVSALHNAWTIATYCKKLVSTFKSNSTAAYTPKGYESVVNSVLDGAFEKADRLAVGDDYRQAQLFLALGRGAPTLTKQKEYFEKVLSLKWPRGKMIAEQNLADLVLKRSTVEDGDISQAFNTLHDLYDSAYRSAESSRGQDSGDVDFLNWTLLAMERISDQHVLVEDEIQMLRNAQERISGLVSEVASVTAYRSSFEGGVLPRLRVVWGDKVSTLISNGGSIDHARENRILETSIDQMESYFGRDVVELLRHKSIQDISERTRIEQARSVHSSFQSGNACQTAEDPKGPLADLTPMAGEQQKYFSTWLEEQQAASEIDAFQAPFRFSGNSQSVSLEAKNFSAIQQGTLLLQYRILGGKGKESMHVFAWFNGTLEVLDLGRKPIELRKEILSDRFCMNGDKSSIAAQITAARIPSKAGATEIWKRFLLPVIKALSRRGGSADALGNCEAWWKEKVSRVIAIPELSCASVPLNLAWDEWNNCPVAMSKPLIFSLSLSALLVYGRFYKFNQLARLKDDDAFFLWNLKEQGSQTGDQMGYRQIHHALKEVDSSLLTLAKPNLKQWEAIATREAEVLVIGCHGRLYGAQAVLEFDDGFISNLRLEQTAFLRRTKLLVLAACESGRSDSWYSTMVANLVAAGAGAIVSYPRKCFIRVLGDQSVGLVKTYFGNAPLKLDETLQLLAANCKVDLSQWASDEEAKIHCSMAQLWL